MFKENAIINAISVDELAEAKEMINQRLLEKVADRIDELKNNITLLPEAEQNEEEGDTEYQKFFRKALEKFGVDSPADFESEEKKKEFFDYVDKEYKADKEED
tara:strand:- start:13325 stop:13633 length:309 start_codon:yes stop_codon:yes gene_type:complete